MERNSIRKHSIGEISKIMGVVQQSERLHVCIDKGTIADNFLQYPFRSDAYAIVLMLSGKMKVQLDLITYTIEPNDLIICSPQTVKNIVEREPGTKLVCIKFTFDFRYNNSINKRDFDLFLLQKRSFKMSLQKSEIDNIVSIAELLRKKNIENDPRLFGKEMIDYTFHLLLYEIAALYKKNNLGMKIEMSRKEELTLNFLKVLEDNFKKERSVQFYADSLFVTTGHLTKVLKEVSGKTTGELIDEIVVMEARMLLAYTSLSVSQIAEELQFSDQSCFGKFFKKHITLSPLEYRRKIDK